MTTTDSKGERELDVSRSDASRLTPAQSRPTHMGSSLAGLQPAGSSQLRGVGNDAAVLLELVLLRLFPPHGGPAGRRPLGLTAEHCAPSTFPAPLPWALGGSGQCWARPAGCRDPGTLGKCRASKSLLYSALQGSCISLVQASQGEIKPTDVHGSQREFNPKFTISEACRDQVST